MTQRYFFHWAKLCLSLNWRTQPLLASRQGLCGNINDFANMNTGKSRSFIISNQLDNSSSMEAGYDSISFPHFSSFKTLMTLTFLRGCCFTNFLNSGILKLKCSCCFSIISTGQIKMLYFFFFFFWELNLICVVFGSVDSMQSLLDFSLYHLSNLSKSSKSCNSFTLMLLSYFLGLPTGRAVSSFFLVFQQITSSLNMWWYVFTQKRIGRSLFSFYFSSFLSFEKLWYSCLRHD